MADSAEEDTAEHPAPKPEPCGWTVRTSNLRGAWRCNRPFAHRGPHALISPRGRVNASAIGFR